MSRLLRRLLVAGVLLVTAACQAAPAPAPAGPEAGAPDTGSRAATAAPAPSPEPTSSGSEAAASPPATVPAAGVAVGPPAGAPVAAMPAHCQYGHDGPAVLPDPVCTPGLAAAEVTQDNIDSTICVRGYTTGVRPPASYTGPLKRESMAAYGSPGTTSDYEFDHLVPLELGGHPSDPRNLWPQPAAPAPGFKAKDGLENWLRGRVCAHAMALADAQRAIAGDWYATWVVDGRP